MDLKNKVRERIMEGMIKKVDPDSGWKVLVVDQHATRVISQSCRMFDVMDNGVTIVENIALKRKRFDYFEAIYFVEPTKKNFEIIAEDFEKEHEEQYAAAHIFATGIIPPDALYVLTSNRVATKIKTLEEFYVDYLPYEERVFHIDRPSFMHEIYSNKSQAQSLVIERTASQLATVFGTLGYYPTIKFMKSSPWNERLANQLIICLDEMASEKPLPTGTGDNAVELLILGRDFDPVSPVLHECTYQCMAYDYLPIDGDKYNHSFAGADGKTVKRDIIIGEHDPIWSSVRHEFIADAVKEVTTKFKEFMQKANPGKVSMQDKVTFKDLTKAIKDLPQYQEEMSKYSLHMDMSQQCMNTFFGKSGGEQIEKVAVVEQDILAAETAEGDKVKNPVNHIVPVLQDRNIGSDHKLRLLIAFVGLKGGVPANDLQKLIKTAGISEADAAAIHNLNMLGVDVNGKSSQKPYPRRKRNTDGSYALLRWTPIVKDIMEDALDGRLPASHFTAVAGNLTAATAAQTPASATPPQATSARSRPGWAQKKAAGSSAKSAAPAAAPQAKGKKVVVFVIGGISYSEMRCAYEVSKARNADVFIGGTAVLKPEQMLADLKDLGKNKITFL
eukprot:Clim_evm61s149 gene=Clim_evmTU61s149